MPKAIWNGAILAESNDTIVVEGNHYFPPSALNLQYFTECDARTVCSWKGTAGYYDLNVDGQVNQKAAWYYPDPKDEASQIKGYIAFWRGVKVE